MKVTRHTESGVYAEEGVADRETDRFTAYCAAAGTEEGVYDEEIDVDARDAVHATRIAEEAIEMDYDPHAALKVRHVTKRGPGWYL
jgi:hypothetical protein